MFKAIGEIHYVSSNLTPSTSLPVSNKTGEKIIYLKSNNALNLTIT